MINQPFVIRLVVLLLLQPFPYDLRFGLTVL